MVEEAAESESGLSVWCGLGLGLRCPIGSLPGIETMDDRKKDNCDDDLLPAPDTFESKSDLESSTGVLDNVPPSPVEPADRCAQRSRTPSTALKKLVEPWVRVREIASLVGASCSSKRRSWIPSCRRKPMSATTLGFSTHGCLYDCERNEKLVRDY